MEKGRKDNKSFVGLVAGISLVGILSLYSASADDQSRNQKHQEELKVPTYSLEKAKKIEYYVVDLPLAGKSILNLEDLTSLGGMEYLKSNKIQYKKIVDYFVDRNNDGDIDLIHEEVLTPTEFSATKKDTKNVVLYIDDPLYINPSGKKIYDKSINRILFDMISENGEATADGKFDYENYFFWPILNIRDFSGPKLGGSYLLP